MERNELYKKEWEDLKEELKYRISNNCLQNHYPRSNSPIAQMKPLDLIKRLVVLNEILQFKFI